MSNIQVKNVPETLHRRLRSQSKRYGCTMSEFILRAVEAELSRNEWSNRFRRRPHTELITPAAQLIEEERTLRNGEH